MPKTYEIAKKVILNPRLKRYIDVNTDFAQQPDKKFFEGEKNQLLTYVSSVNMPCCVHDGDPKQIMDDIIVAKSFNCAVGAHIAYPDPVNLGYKDMNLSPEELVAWIHVQMGAFRALCLANGIDVEHVRPHGALYGKFFNDKETALLVAKTLYKIDPWIILVGPSGPIMEAVKQEVGLRTAQEVYLGKRYSSDGKIIANRFHENLPPQAILEQARQLMADSSLTAQDGKPVKLTFNTLHISPRLGITPDVAEKLNVIIGQPISLAMAAVGTSGWI